MYEIVYTGQFKRSLKLCVRRGLNIQDFKTVLDWLMIWQQNEQLLRLILVDTGSHSDLF